MKRLLFVALFVIVAGCGSDPADLTLSALFSDGAVLQRDVPIRVWGTATPGDEVSVSVGAVYATDAAGPGGVWRVTLPAMDAGGPFALAVESGGRRLERADILIGDVWIASGQSNMEWPVQSSNDAAAVIASAADRRIRHFKVPRSWATMPERDLAGGDWLAASPEEVGAFTAVGYFFAQEMRKASDVPVGLLNTSWGGSRIEPWMSAEVLGMTAGDVAALAARETQALEAVRARLVKRLGSIPKVDPGLVDGNALWAAPNLDTTNWDHMAVPGEWESQFPGLDGIAWYRTTVTLSASEAAADAVLGLGMIDDSDITWVNGFEVGRMENAWNQIREYVVPASMLREGQNTIAIRVEDTGGNGGPYGASELFFFRTGERVQPLEGDWAFMVGRAVINVGGQRNQTETLLYNKMIRPLTPFAAKGFIWYQGESNAGGQDAVAYRDQFQTMITSWREEWGLGDMPFLWVQLANYMAADTDPAESDWAVLRESQTAALALPNTGQAVIIDIGEADDIHPRNKQDVGYRLSLAARHLAGEELVYSGPMYRSHRIEGRRMVIKFDHVGGGLTARGDRLGGFAIAGADGRYVWASATIRGEEVEVSSPRVRTPVSVRYAWGNNPDRATLYNAEGLPATPFRTN